MERDDVKAREALGTISSLFREVKAPSTVLRRLN